MHKEILKFLSDMIPIIGNRLGGHDFVIVVWDSGGIRYVGGESGSPAETVDMLHAAGHFVQETHLREEGHA